MLGALASLLPLVSSQPDIALNFPVQQLDGLRFWCLFIILIIKSLLRRLRVIPAIRYINHGEYHALVGYKRISLSMPCLSPAGALHTYSEAIGADIQLDQNRLHLHLFLSALTEPTMLVLLSKRGCPIDPIGAVNVRNRFEVLDQGAALDFAREQSHPGGAGADVHISATLRPEAKLVKRGWEYSIVVDLVREGKTIYRQTFTMLQFAKRPRGASLSAPPKRHASPVSGSKTDGLTTGEKTMRMSTRDPASWAKLSKDYNPIHMSTLGARMLGFGSVIAHGNHVVAKAVERVGDSRVSGWMEVEFRRPVLLPAELDVVGQDEEGGKGGVVSISQRGRVCVSVAYGIEQ